MYYSYHSIHLLHISADHFDYFTNSSNFLYHLSGSSINVQKNIKMTDQKWREFFDHAGIEDLEEKEEYLQKLVSENVDLDVLLKFNDDIIRSTLEKFMKCGDVLKCLLYLMERKKVGETSETTTVAGEKLNEMPPCNNGTTFRELRWSSYFVDKTLFIKEVFDRQTKVLLITAPPRFGKSINLSMIREFVEQKQNNENDRNPFEGTNIWKEDEIKPHFHRYIVIHVSFYGAPINKKAAIDDFAFAVSRAYMEHAYLQNSQKLSPDQLLNCKRWCSNMVTNSVLPDSDVLAQMIKRSLYDLKMALEIHHGPEAKFVILIDEFDQIVTNVMLRVDTEEDLEDIIRIRDSIINIIKHYANNVIFSLLTGIADITSVSGSLINNDERYAFLQNKFFFPYYGFLETEFDDVVKRNKIPDDFRGKMKQQYNGYICHGKRLYNTWSVTTAMHLNEIGNYFSRKDLIIQLIPILRDHTMEELIKKIMANSIISYTYPSNPCLSTKDLFKLAQCCKCSNVTMDEHVFLDILFQMGYLTFVEMGKLKVPNLSIVNTLEYMYYCHFETHWHLDLKLVDECAMLFPNFDLFDKIDLTKFCIAFQKILLFDNIEIPLNHQVLHSVLFLIAMKIPQKCEFASFECPVTEDQHSNRCDIVLCLGYYKIVLIIEIKYKVNVEKAMKQIESRKYDIVVKNPKIVKHRKNVKYIVKFGISVSEKKEVSMMMEIFDYVNESTLKSISAVS